MLDIISWLLTVEKKAEEMYNLAAEYFRDDESLKNFLENLAADEAWHFHAMSYANEHYLKNPAYETSVIVDQDIKERIEGVFSMLHKHLEAGTLTKGILHEGIITTEFSEWNDIFLYVIDSMKTNIDEFKNIGSRIQHHKRKIELFYDTCPDLTDCDVKIDKLKNLEPIWSDNILVVDDEEPITDLLEAILESEGKVDKAHDGNEALEKLKNKYYDLIISDVDMPGLNGIAFFEKASEIYHGLNERFIFFTGLLTDEKLRYFKEKNVGFMQKPVRMNQIKEKALGILFRDSGKTG